MKPDSLDRLRNAAKRASGFLDLAKMGNNPKPMEKLAVDALESVLGDDDYIDRLYEEDMKEIRELYEE